MGTTGTSASTTSGTTSATTHRATSGTRAPQSESAAASSFIESGTAASVATSRSRVPVATCRGSQGDSVGESPEELWARLTELSAEDRATAVLSLDEGARDGLR